MGPSIKILIFLGIVAAGCVAIGSFAGLLAVLFILCAILSFFFGVVWAIANDERREQLKRMWDNA